MTTPVREGLQEVNNNIDLYPLLLNNKAKILREIAEKVVQTKLESMVDITMLVDDLCTQFKITEDMHRGAIVFILMILKRETDVRDAVEQLLTA